MYTINLDPRFCPVGAGDAADVSHPFPSGVEVNFCLSVPCLSHKVGLTCRIGNSDAILSLLMATDACRRAGAKDIHLFIPYLPYARQDRACSRGEAFALKVFADLLNGQEYASVTIFDPHSDVAPALIERSVVIDNTAFVAAVLSGKSDSDYRLVAPDAGAAKKVVKVAEALSHKEPPVQCIKRRIHGKVMGVEVFCPDFEGKDAYIIDDICDGGATFTEVAQALRQRNVGTVNLVVSHGIFSRGLDVLKDGGIDHVYTTDSFKNQEHGDFLTEVKLSSIIAR